MNSLTISQLREIGDKYDIHIPDKCTKTGIISRLMDLPRSTIKEEVNALL